jgi:hypothetical protein
LIKDAELVATLKRKSLMESDKIYDITARVDLVIDLNSDLPGRKDKLAHEPVYGYGKDDEEYEESADYVRAVTPALSLFLGDQLAPIEQARLWPGYRR